MKEREYFVVSSRTEDPGPRTPLVQFAYNPRVPPEPESGTHRVDATGVTLPVRDLRSNRGGGDTSTVPGPSFARGLWRIAAADVSSGNRVTLLRDGPATFDAMLELIDVRRRRVALESYIFRSDEVGRALRRRARRAPSSAGVAVRLLLDWIGARGTSRKFHQAASKRPASTSRSSTRRAFAAGSASCRATTASCSSSTAASASPAASASAASGRPACTSGIAPAGATPPCRSTGPAARDMIQAFDHMWRRAIGTRTARLAPLSAPAGARRAPRSGDRHAGARRHRRRRAAAASRLARAADPGDLRASARSGSPPRTSRRRRPRSRRSTARRATASTSASSLPSRNDHPWVSLLARRYYRRLLTNGVRIWEWQGEMMHAKTSVVDGRWVRVGSTDFNPLGVAINYELDAVIEDAALGQAAERMFLADLEESREVTLEPLDALSLVARRAATGLLVAQLVHGVAQTERHVLTARRCSPGATACSPAASSSARSPCARSTRRAALALQRPSRQQQPDLAGERRRSFATIALPGVDRSSASSMYAAGRLTHAERLAQLGLHGTEALVDRCRPPERSSRTSSVARARSSIRSAQSRRLAAASRLQEATTLSIVSVRPHGGGVRRGGGGERRDESVVAAGDVLRNRPRAVRRRGRGRPVAHVQQPPLGERRHHRRGDRHLRRHQGGALSSYASWQSNRSMALERVVSLRGSRAQRSRFPFFAAHRPRDRAIRLGVRREARHRRDVRAARRVADALLEIQRRVRPAHGGRAAAAHHDHRIVGDGSDLAATSTDEELRAALEPVAAATPPFTVRSEPPMRFMQSTVVVMPIDPNGPIRALHERIKSSGLRYEQPRFTFTPHCTLSFYPELARERLRELLRVRIDEPVRSTRSRPIERSISRARRECSTCR